MRLVFQGVLLVALVVVAFGCAKQGTDEKGAEEAGKKAATSETSEKVVFDKAAAAKVLEAAKPLISECWKDYGKQNPDSEGGKVVVKVTVGTDGKAATEAVENALGDAAVIECMAEKIGTLAFPTPSEKAVEMTVPFVFRREAGEATKKEVK
jgi:hypothetical protein